MKSNIIKAVLKKQIKHPNISGTAILIHLKMSAVAKKNYFWEFFYQEDALEIQNFLFDLNV